MEARDKTFFFLQVVFIRRCAISFVCWGNAAKYVALSVFVGGCALPAGSVHVHTGASSTSPLIVSMMACMTNAPNVSIQFSTVDNLCAVGIAFWFVVSRFFFLRRLL